MEIKKFENSLIAFDFEKEMVNATDMAKKFGKRPNDFLQIDATQKPLLKNWKAIQP